MYAVHVFKTAQAHACRGTRCVPTVAIYYMRDAISVATQCTRRPAMTLGLFVSHLFADDSCAMVPVREITKCEYSCTVFYPI